LATREQNERRYPTWGDLPDGGRRYYRIVKGAVQGYARYVKVVDTDEMTLSIVQEIYDNDDRLMAVHQKYPEDTGHQEVPVEEDGTE
jgi:hypothetical protein